MRGWFWERAKALGARLLHLVERPTMQLESVKRGAFAALADVTMQGGSGTVIPYTLPYPKYEFLRYMVETHGVRLHGSNRTDLGRLEPRPQTTFYGRPTHAVFATPDEIWCLFYAIINNQGFYGSKRNNCFRVRRRDCSLTKFYWFSLSEPMLRRPDPFTDGVIYLLPGQTFSEGEIPDEWLSDSAVTPIAKLPVSPADFPFLRAVTGHADGESVWRFFGRMLWQRPTRPH